MKHQVALTQAKESPLTTETSPKLAYRVDQKRGELPASHPNAQTGLISGGQVSGPKKRPGERPGWGMVQAARIEDERVQDE